MATSDLPSDLPFTPSYETCNDGVTLICPIELTIYGYRPQLGATITFAVIFSICFLAQFGLAFRLNNYGFPTWILIGIGLEVTGWYARMALNFDPWSWDAMVAR
jgi:hypothetical protein